MELLTRGLRAIADPRTIEILEAIHARRHELHHPDTRARADALLPPLIAELRARRPAPLDDDAAARCAKIARLLSGDAATGEAMLARIYERPDDDQLRLVYADWLLERGDPRGELIALQFRRARADVLSTDEQRREGELLRRHRREWLGAIAPVVESRSVRFERGFVDACLFTGWNRYWVEEALPSPAWSTLRELTAIGEPWASRLLAQPSLRSLRVLTTRHETLHALAEREVVLPVERLKLVSEPMGAQAEQVLARYAGLPSLRELELHGMIAAVRWVIQSELMKRLERLTIASAYGSLLEWVRAARRLALPSTLREVHYRETWQLSLVRGDANERWQLHARDMQPLDLRAALLEIPEGAISAVVAEMATTPTNWNLATLHDALLRHASLTSFEVRAPRFHTRLI
jgi:uncharacterized protein (TIGR02996 family)